MIKNLNQNYSMNDEKTNKRFVIEQYINCVA